MADLIADLCGKGAVLGLERLNAAPAIALQAQGQKIVDTQDPVEMARAVKSVEKMRCVNASLRVTEVGVGKLRDAIRPGMIGEYPYLYRDGGFPDAGYDGVILSGMTLCAESYIGEAGGKEGVKLEPQVLLTDTGITVLSRFPFEGEGVALGAIATILPRSAP